MRTVGLLLGSAVIIALVTPASAVSYTGTLTSMGGGLTGKGVWNRNKQDLTTAITWTVDDTTTPGMWHYHYTLTVPNINHRKDEFRFIRLESTTGFVSADVSNLTGNSLTNIDLTKVGTFKKGGGMPSKMFGMQVNHPRVKGEPQSGDEGHVIDISFDSGRAPVWGDMFARGYRRNLIRNAGFTKKDTDPTAGPSDGSLQFHLLVPDPPSMPDTSGITPPPSPGVIPEPITMLMLGLGLVPIGARLRRRLAH